MSYGNQRKVEIARALATSPKLLLLDEPAAGMNHSETDELARLIFDLKNKQKKLDYIKYGDDDELSQIRADLIDTYDYTQDQIGMGEINNEK